MFSKFFFRKSCSLWDNVEEYGGAKEAKNYVTVLRTRIACWISKATRAYAHSHVHAPGHPRPGRFTPRQRKWYPLYRRLDGPKGRSRLVRKISSPQGFDSRAIHLLFSCYTDWAIPGPTFTFRTASKVSTSEIQTVYFLSFHKLGRLSLYEFIHLFLRAWSQDRTLTLNGFFMKLSIVKKNTT
jgi:hypothetical protein